MVFETLDSVCRNQILHYDIKPANVLIRLESPERGFVGVLADVDDVVWFKNCSAQGTHDLLGRPNGFLTHYLPLWAWLRRPSAMVPLSNIVTSVGTSWPSFWL